MILNVEESKTETIIDDLKRGRRDLGLLVTPLEDLDLREIPLFQEPFVANVPKSSALASRDTLSDQDLAKTTDLKLLLLGEGHCMRNQMLSELCGP